MMDMEICVDCAMVHANNDWSGIEEDRIAEVEQGLEQYPFLALGDDTIDFTWRPCQACGSRLGGARFTATATI
jgi:hypothetical protein